MGENLIIGLITMAVCLSIQCVIVGVMLEALIFLEKRGLIRHTLIGVSSLLVVVMLIMLAGNLIQITLWAGLFFAFGEFTDFATAFYHSVVNFATLGYGDILMSDKRRLLGALEAANGVLMFGLTTGFLYTVLSGLLQRYWDEQIGKS
ncbi:ion channel [Thermodesulfobacteriota bacterium]